MFNIEKQYDSIKTLEVHRDSLSGCIRKISEFLEGESGITRFLSELQTAIPEGMRVEELILSEKDAYSWRLTIRFFTVSSALVKPMIDNISGIKGVQDTRLVYSEQVPGKGSQKGGLRVKLEANCR